MVKENVFQLGHVALYAKGWYKRFDLQGRGNHKTIFDDLRVCLSLDGYSGECFSKEDVALKLLSSLSSSFPDKRCTDLEYFASEVSINNAWKYGYYYKECIWINNQPNLQEYNYMLAITHYCLSNISMLSKDEFVRVKPIYSIRDAESAYITKVLPRPNRVTNKKLKEMFG